MEQNLTDEFLDLYRILEIEGKEKYFPKSGEGENIIGRLMNTPQLREYKEDINYCRVVRNFLVHTPKVNQTYSIMPSPEMVAFLKDLIKEIKSVKILYSLQHAILIDKQKRLMMMRLVLILI